jgi:CRISPR-associated protein Cmr6
MPIAAVPRYLQKDDSQFYLSAPPGHRFMLYFAVWGDNQETDTVDWRMKDRVPRIDKKTGQQKAGKSGPEWDDLPNDQYACTIAACKAPSFEEEKPRRTKPKSDLGLKPWQPMMKGLCERQTAIARAFPGEALLCLNALATAPFTTGLGNEHPLENGFAFLNPYGLPYLPGSGVKGVLRQAARELASGDWGEAHGWKEDKCYTVMHGGGEKRCAALDKNKQPVTFSMLDALFGSEAPNGDTHHLRGALVFWDVVPQIKGDSLAVDIMTPHQSHYYQPKKDQQGAASPHESGQPTPISFLTVPPGSAFVFHVQCDLAHLHQVRPDIATGDRWKTLLEAAFAHAFQWLGFGAKTAVGYGAMQPDIEAKKRAEADSARREEEARRAEEEGRRAAQREAELARLSPIERSIRELLDTRPDRQQPEVSAVIGAVKQGRWTGDERIAVAQWLLKTMQTTKGQWKETSQAKKPEKDREYQNTLLVKSWLGGK